MTLPASGAISMSQIDVELGKASNSNVTLNDTNVRNLAGKSSGSISLSNFYGKRAYTPMTLNGVGDNTRTYDTSNGGGTATASPYVGVTGGVSPFTYKWVMNSYSGSTPTLSNDTSATCSVSRTFIRYSSGTFDALLTCTVTDSTGATASVSNVDASAQWGQGI